MGRPVVHFEIIGADPERLQSFYADLFDWEYALGDSVSPAVSAPGRYGYIDGTANGDAQPNGGVAGGPDHEPRLLFYVGVEDVEATLARAEALGGRREFGPDGRPGELIVGRFSDPEGNQVGLAGPG
ncbi:MAG: VOC family protein [Actinobacteria bacterium]|nr:VOC family protein [Actinomycetota bacterium]